MKKLDILLTQLPHYHLVSINSKHQHLSSGFRRSRQRQRNSEPEDRRALRLPLHVCGRAAEEEDDPQRHQQQEVEPHRQNHHQRRAGPAGKRRNTQVQVNTSPGCCFISIRLLICLREKAELSLFYLFKFCHNFPQKSY